MNQSIFEFDIQKVIIYTTNFTRYIILYKNIIKIKERKFTSSSSPLESSQPVQAQTSSGRQNRSPSATV